MDNNVDAFTLGTATIPKDGTLLITMLFSKDGYIALQYDVQWGGGRGAWFTMDNKLIPEKDIMQWRKATPAEVRLYGVYYAPT